MRPNSDNGRLAGGAFAVDVGGKIRPTFGFGYWLSDNIQLEVLAALPFEHDVRLNGANAATFKHLPPTVSLQYHFAPGASICPFVGLGLNYTVVFDEKTRGPLAGADLSLGNSSGLARQAGIEFKIDDRWAAAAEVRWFDIDSDARVNGADVGPVTVDPIAFGLCAIYKF